MKIFYNFFFVSCLTLFFANNIAAQNSDRINVMKLGSSMAFEIEMVEDKLPFKTYYNSSNTLTENISALNYRDLKRLHGERTGMTKGGAIVLGGVAGFLAVWGISSISCSGSSDYGVCQSLSPIAGLVVGVPIGALTGAALSKNKSMYERRRR